MYANNLVLLSASVYDLLRLLDILFGTADSLSLKFTCQKSCCLAFRPRSNDVIERMNLDIGAMDWCSNVKYFGVLMKSARHLVIDIDVAVRKFYMASNTVFSNFKGIDEMTKLRLQETYCLPILSYALRALKLNDTQVRTLNSCWNSAYR